MRNSFKNLWQLVIVYALWSPTLHAVSLPQQIATLTAGTALAFIGHNALEYLSTTAHELGHAGMNKLLTGNTSSIHVTPAQQGMLNLIQPWVGHTALTPSFNIGKGAHTLITLAGPVTGLLMTYLQLYCMHLLEKKCAPLERQGPWWQQPFLLFKSLYQRTKDITQTTVEAKKLPELQASIGQVALSVLTFLRCSRLVGEALYGFTPITVPQGTGDGQVLWHNLLNKTSREYPSLSNRLLLITSSIMLSPLLAGIGKALITTTQTTMRNHEKVL